MISEMEGLPMSKITSKHPMDFLSNVMSGFLIALAAFTLLPLAIGALIKSDWCSLLGKHMLWTILNLIGKGYLVLIVALCLGLLAWAIHYFCKALRREPVSPCTR